MKKILLLVIIAVLFFIMAFGCSCSGRRGVFIPETDTSNIISLDLSNYSYYLSIRDVVTSSVSAVGGAYHAVCHEVTISGAVYGLYRNCSLYYIMVGGDAEVEHEVKLNAAGYGEFKYNTLSYRDTNIRGVSYVRVEGEIVQ
ncbi:MAG TPA: hypothetical protein DIC18_03365 [Clostridiales bacterium]|nr:hypothetical protein [Clostridiales bacterium]